LCATCGSDVANGSFKLGGEAIPSLLAHGALDTGGD
jgi:hypothetical protein